MPQSDVGHVAGAAAWDVRGRAVLLCTMKHSTTVFMYLPILRTLRDGFRALGAANVTVTSGSGPTWRSALLQAGDVLLWVGMGNGHTYLPMVSLGNRGVKRVIYFTEPMTQTCGALNLTTSPRWDEVWHYTLHNAALCWQSVARPGSHRYVPPGALGADLFRPEEWENSNAIPPERRASQAIFLGIIPSSSNGLDNPAAPGYARRACYAALKRDLGTHLAHHENAWGMPRVRQLLRSRGTFVNLHKDCGRADRPAEGVGFSLLLSAGARIVSERANEADERQYAGFVTFAALPQLGQAVTSALAEQAAEPDGASEARATAFRERFAATMIFARAGLGSPGTTSGTSIVSSISKADDAAAACRYEPGAVEREWFARRATGRICSIARSSSQLDGVRSTLAYAHDTWGDGLRPPTPAEGAMLSRLACAGHGSSRLVRGFLEPLTGVARHPLAKVGCHLPSEVDIFDISHLVLANGCARRGSEPPPRGRGRHLFYDLGCSTYSMIPLCELYPRHRRCVGKVASPPPSPPRPPPADTTTRSAPVAHGPSLPLFIELYRRNCIDFDRIYAWEAVKYPPRLWWRDVPAAVRAKLEFFNVPIDETAAPRATTANEDASFLRKLVATARPEDFVVLKVDVDGGPELAIVEAIASRPELAALVDEIFFEYHFWFDGLVGPGWRIRRPGTRGRHRLFEIETNATVDDALELMHRLRVLGIRSHFWI